jgi:hypothetical protein
VPRIGDDWVSPKEYQKLRERYREAQTPVPWDRWSRRYISPAGRRDREVVQAQQKAEARRQRAISDGTRQQVQQMNREFDPIGRQEATIREMGRVYAT